MFNTIDACTCTCISAGRKYVCA